MLITVQSCALSGIDMQPFHIRVNLAYGAPAFVAPGLAEPAARAARDRVRSALATSGLDWPPDRIALDLDSLEPGNAGSLHDLPIALGILAASGALPTSFCEQVLVLGELSLSGELRPVRGALAAALLARTLGLDLLLPLGNAPEAALIAGVRILGARSLGEAVAHLRGTAPLRPIAAQSAPRPDARAALEPDLADVAGQGTASRALLIAAAGEHNLLLVGPPGSGKTRLARRLPGLLPPLSAEERLETARVYSAAGLLSSSGQGIIRRPFRAPHHSISDAGLAGGGGIPRPGELSLAHNGVLFLDELPEFRRSALETLRQPLERGHVQFSRARRSVTLPARFLLCAAMNPCPCGYSSALAELACRCSARDRRRHLARMNGVLLEQSDLRVRVLPVSPTAADSSPPIGSAEARQAVLAARRMQSTRGQGVPNGRLDADALAPVLCLTDTGRAALRDEAERLGLDAPGRRRLLRISRTIADLSGAGQVTAEHLLEALAFCQGLEEL